MEQLGVWRMIRRKPIRRVSTAMAKKLREYAKKRKAFLDGKRCAVFPHLEATEIHHVRGRLGPLLLDERHWLAVSRAGHLWIDAFRDEARAKGWLAQRGDWHRTDDL